MKPIRYFFPYFLIIFIFYFWTASNGLFKSFTFEKNGVGAGRHQQIAEAFIHGQLYMLEEPKQELLELSNPYDPNLNDKHRLHDAVLYKGKYYQYFSPVASILFNIPLRVLTGYYFTDALLGAILCFIGFVFNFLVFRNIILLLSQKLSFLYQIFSLFAIAFAANTPYLLRRLDSYEICIAGGYCFLMAGLYFITRELTNNRNSTINYSLFGLFIGLAIANRPNLILPIGVISIGLLIYLAKTKPIIFLWRRIFSALIPLMVIVIAMGFYNYLRFDSFFEFGLKYQLSGIDTTNVPAYSFHRILPGWFAYLFHPYKFDLIFPFFHAVAPLKPEGLLSKIWFTEPVIGLFSYPIFWLFPFQILLIKVFFSNHKYTALTTATLYLASFGCLTLSSSLMGVTMRYTQDFLPLFLLGFLISQYIYIKILFNEQSGGLKAGFLYFYISVFITCMISFFLSLTGYLDTLQRMNPNSWKILKNFFTYML